MAADPGRGEGSTRQTGEGPESLRPVAAGSTLWSTQRHPKVSRLQPCSHRAARRTQSRLLTELACLSNRGFFMTLSVGRLRALLAALLVSTVATAAATPRPPQYPQLPSETPAHFTPDHSGFGYTIREVMIPMRDKVKLHTVIMIPKGGHDAPMLLTRTPYDAKKMVTETEHGQLSGHIGTALQGYDNAVPVIVEGGYIRVIQDVRGKYGSEGDFVMNRPMRGPLNPTPVDESTDTYDTIDWLVRHVSASNGKVGILGISYDGFEPLTAAVNPHPALKVVVPMNPMVDGWMGDDWFHNGAFREQNAPYVYEQEGARGDSVKWWSNYYDDYDLYMHYGSAGALGKAYGMDQL